VAMSSIGTIYWNSHRQQSQKM